MGNIEDDTYVILLGPSTFVRSNDLHDQRRGYTVVQGEESATRFQGLGKVNRYIREVVGIDTIVGIRKV